jgi:molecular chaperone DnaJ
MFGGEGGPKRGNVQAKGQDVLMNLEIDFMDAINGATKQVSFGRTDVCEGCKGSRAKAGTSPSTCGGCGGQGYQTIR